jgi:hypothetical protein
MRTPSPSESPVAPATASPAASTDLKRRRFLCTLGASGAGAAAVALNAIPGTAAAAGVAAAPAEPDAGYRVTDHVRAYYRTFRV